MSRNPEIKKEFEEKKYKKIPLVSNCCLGSVSVVP